MNKVQIADKCNISRTTLDNVLAGADAKISTVESLVKQIIDHDVERGLITIHSLNPLYEDTVIALKVDGKAIVRKVDTADESSLSVVDAHGTCTAIDVSGVIYRATKVERSI
jgi:predicted transcriptional regulator